MRIPNRLSALLQTTPATVAQIVTDGKYLIPKHINLIDKYLVGAALRKHRRLIVNMPPRHGKSELISKYFPFWYLGLFPCHRVILTSYEATYAASWGRKVRDLIAEQGQKLFNLELADGSTAIQNFTLKTGGSMNTAGAGGAITGKGADLLIIDDPVKNDSEANSQTIRDNTWDWFASTAFTRIEPNGVIVIIMTRWNEDDLAGRLIANYSEDWTVIKLPAIAEDDDMLGRRHGEALWSERFSLEQLNDIKKQIGSHWFNALYQQSPSQLGGTIFKRSYFKYYSIEGDFYHLHSEQNRRVLRSDCSMFATVDLAISTNQRSDYTCIVVFGVSRDRDIIIVNILRERIDGAKHLELISNIHKRHNLRLIGIENVQYQASLISQARAIGLPIKSLKPDKDKYTRALPIAALFEAGKVYFQKDADWLIEFERELLSFPHGKHDDQVDALAYIPNMLPPEQISLPGGAKKLNLSCFANS